MLFKNTPLLPFLFILGIFCSCNNISDFDDVSVITFSEAQLTQKNLDQQLVLVTPKTRFFQFLEMVDSIKEMELEELKILTDEEANIIGKPIYDVIDDTEILSTHALRRIAFPLNEMKAKALSLNNEDHKRLSIEVVSMITPMAGFNSARRRLNTDRLRQLLIEIHDASPEQGAGCSTLFNKTEDLVVLFERDNFAVANAICPEGTTFFIMPGLHKQQVVLSSKKGNNWFGLDLAVMDGMNLAIEAFDGNFVNHIFAFFEIRNYREFGIVDNNGESIHTTIRRMIFRNIGENVDGQTYSAVKFLRSQHIEVRESYFENVTSSIHFATSKGPLKVLGNDALNPGRNFFQCDKCFGPEIHILNNSMENTTGFGLDKLEDFINIFASEGEVYSPIRVNYNRARTNGMNLSPSGSFIILGDFGGKHQEAIGNIGVNPGQVGIGVASGDHILVENNRMFSTLIDGISNVAFYSWRTPNHAPACSDHKFRNNKANWICGRTNVCRYGELNRGWTNGNCGLSNEELLVNTHDDITMTADIWYDTSSQNNHNPNPGHGSIGSNYRDFYWFYGEYDDALPGSKPRVNY
ncbi:MAG: hypothetical protein EA359_10350 [Balneolaceae bacterium]|nr:MAG: hypothetical protein EA359_10350 [Balneolaceae bacterium]